MIPDRSEIEVSVVVQIGESHLGSTAVENRIRKARGGLDVAQGEDRRGGGAGKDRQDQGDENTNEQPSHGDLRMSVRTEASETPLNLETHP